MSELTKEYFEEHLHKQLYGLEGRFDKKLEGLETRITDKFDKKLVGLESRLTKKFEDGIEGLARMVEVGFQDIQRRLDFSDRVTSLEKDMLKMKNALNLPT